MKGPVLSIVFSFLFAFTAFGQIDSIQVTVSGAAGVGSAGFMPFHMGFNQFGRFDPNQQDGYFQADLIYPILNKGKWKIESGVSYVVKPRIDESFFHQGYMTFSYDAFDLRVGKVAVQNALYNDALGSGSFFQSQNNKTISKIGFGIWDYTPIPFFKYLEVYGIFEVGLLDKDRPVTDAYIHEKSAYVKISNLPIEPFAGVSHVALFGGVTPTGEELPSNFVKVFFAQQAINSGNPSDSSNAAGAHFGLFDLGFDLPFQENNLRFSFQQLISDASGFSASFTKNSDYIISVDLKLDDHPILENIYYENISTVNQSGPGTSDPFVNGQFTSTRELNAVEDYDAYLLDNFGIITQDVTWPEFFNIVRDEINFGYAFGGRDDHFNNDQFPNGNTFHRMTLVNPLMMTQDRFTTLTGRVASDDKLIVNNRVIAHHFGFGSKIKDLKLKLKATIAYNYGTYAGQYGGSRRSWVIDPDYYFRDVVTTRYLSLEGSKKLKNGLEYNGQIAGDVAEFGNNWGILVGVKYRLK